MEIVEYLGVVLQDCSRYAVELGKKRLTCAFAETRSTHRLSCPLSFLPRAEGKPTKLKKCHLVMHMCLYIRIYICMYIYICIYIYIQLYVCICTLLMILFVRLH